MKTYESNMVLFRKALRSAYDHLQEDVEAGPLELLEPLSELREAIYAALEAARTVQELARERHL